MPLGFSFLISFLEAQLLEAVERTAGIKLKSYYAHVLAVVHTNLCTLMSRLQVLCIHDDTPSVV